MSSTVYIILLHQYFFCSRSPLKADFRSLSPQDMFENDGKIFWKIDCDFISFILFVIQQCVSPLYIKQVDYVHR